MSTKLLLNVGAGGGRVNAPGYDEITVDLPGTFPCDREGSLLALPATDGEVDVVVLSHILEHVPHHEVPAALAEARRVLVAGGIVHVRVPDLEQVCAAIGQHGLHAEAYVSPIGPVTLHDMLYGNGRMLAQGQASMAHRTGFTGATLRAALEAAGFTAVQGERHPFELRAEGITPPPAP